MYLQPPQIATSITGLPELVDLLWYNTGLVVTTVGEQTFTQPATSVAARDLNGSANGEGVNAAVYVTTATTNAGAIANMTLRYTNSDGVDNRTATIASFPITAVIGTVVPFQLQAGDRGIRSIQGITLGTSLAAGAISVIMYRKLASVPIAVTNVGAVGTVSSTDPTGIKLWPGTMLWWILRASGTTACTINGSVRVVER